MARDLARRYLLRRYLLFLVVLLTLFLLVLRLAPRPQGSWLPGLVAGFSLAYLRSLVRAYRTAVRDAQSFGSDPVTLRLAEDQLEIVCPLFRQASSWPAFPSVAATVGYLVLQRRGSAQLLAIPSSALSPEATAFLVERIRRAGGRLLGADPPAPSLGR